MALTGYICYGLFCTYGYFVDDESTGTVDLNDLIYVYNQTFFYSIVLIQIYLYPHGTNTLHPLIKGLLISTLSFFLLYGILTLVIMLINRAHAQSNPQINWICLA